MSQWQSVVVVLGVLVWWISPPSGLGDLARRETLRRQIVPGSARLLTNQDIASLPPRASPTVPPSGTTSAAAAADPVGGVKPTASPEETATGTHDEPWWRARITAARAALDRDQLLADAMQSRINALTNDASARDDPAQRAVLVEQRLRAIAELDNLKKVIEADRRTIDGIGEEARKQNVPPGWIR